MSSVYLTVTCRSTPATPTAPRRAPLGLGFGFATVEVGARGGRVPAARSLSNSVEDTRTHWVPEIAPTTEASPSIDGRNPALCQLPRGPQRGPGSGGTTMWRRSLFLLLAGVVAACGHDESRDDVGVDTASDTSDTDAGDTDTGDTDASDTDTDNEIDTAPPEPTGARIVDPAGGSVEGWTVVNRYGRTSSNALGEFTLPFDNDGMTLTLAWPPSRDPAKGTLALLTTYEPDDETPRAEPVITSRTTALALTVLHPALASRDPWHVEHALDAAAASDKVVAVEGAVTSAWQGGQSVLEDPALRGAVAAAAADLGTRIASPFQDAVHLAGPVPRRDLWVHPLDQRGLFEAERAGPDVSFVTAPSYPLALAIDASPVLADGVVTGPDGSRTLAARADLDALEEGATLYDFVSEGPSQPANLFPRAAAAVRGPVTASLGTTASAHVALDERLYHVVAHSGAVAGEGALERWSKAPSTANRGLSLNLAFAARERLATAGVEPSATCLTGAVAVWRSETSSLASAVANDQGPRAAHDGLVALLNGARDCGASAADGFDALAWGLLTELTALADPSDYRFAPYDQRLRYLLHPPSELPTQGALIVAPGDGVTPFAPHVDTAAGSAIDPAKRVTVSPGAGWVPATSSRRSSGVKVRSSAPRPAPLRRPRSRYRFRQA